MIDEVKRELEKQELNALIGNGISFSIERTVCLRKPGLLGRFAKRTKKVEKLKFRIQEPTLAVLDLISMEQIDMPIDEKIMQSEGALGEARKLVHAHARRQARIIALAVLGEDYIKAEQIGSRIKYTYDDKKLEELTELFYSNVKPSKLMQLVTLVSTMSNLGDFTHSIRLMSANRTTMPILIEENKKD